MQKLTDVIKLFPHLRRVQPGILGSLALVVALSSSGTTAPLDIKNSSVAPTTIPATKNQPDRATQAKVLEAYGQLPLSFEANQGQVDKSVNFLARGSGYSVFLTPTEAVLSLRATRTQPSTVRYHSPAQPELTAKTDTTVLRLQLVGSNPTAPVKSSSKLSGKSNYLTGNNPRQWQTNISHYAKVKYQGVYPGIDLVYYGNQRQLEYDFIIAPGANPKNIQFQITGAKRLEIDKHGNLVLHTDSGAIRQHRPVIYQDINGKRRNVAGSYVLLGQQKVGFTIAAYEASVPLVIDPIVSYSTYLGGSSSDYGRAIAADSTGNVYVTGDTSSTNFPTKNAFDSTLNAKDAFVTKLKLTATGSASLVYSTYLGGSGTDIGYGIAVDKFGNAYVTGYTTSSNFPLQNAFDVTKSGYDAFVTKLNATGSSLLYSTYLGGSTGSGNEYGYGIVVEQSGNAYVAGYTNSNDFPTKNAYRNTRVGSSDAFVTKLNPAAVGSASLIYSTYLGGTSNDYGYGIAADSNGNAYVTGSTRSTNFPTQNLYKALGGSADPFVTKVNATGNTLLYSTYLGGKSEDYASAIALDSTGYVYIAGRTSSTDLPTKNAFDSTFNNYYDAFVMKLNPTASGAPSLVYSSYLGGSSTEYGYGIAVDSKGNVYVAGETKSADFPTKNAFDSTYGGSSATDAFVTKIAP